MSSLANNVTSSQNRAIFHHLQTIGPISAKTAIEQYGCYRLSARIFDIKKRGFEVNTKMIEFTNKNGHRGRYALYSIVKQQ